MPIWRRSPGGPAAVRPLVVRRTVHQPKHFAPEQGRVAARRREGVDRGRVDGAAFGGEEPAHAAIGREQEQDGT